MHPPEAKRHGGTIMIEIISTKTRFIGITTVIIAITRAPK